MECKVCGEVNIFIDDLGIHDVHKRISNFSEHCLALKEDKSVNYVSYVTDKVGTEFCKCLSISFHSFCD